LRGLFSSHRSSRATSYSISVRALAILPPSSRGSPGAVVALEEDAALCASAQETLSSLGYDNVAVVEGRLAAGYDNEGPYDVIIIEGAVEKLPVALFDQLKEDGRLVVVEGLGNAAVVRLYIKQDGITRSRRAFNASVKPLPGFNTEPSFVF
jgi:protein-L-isoaspartate(D-aspartate) O-methyltransferase